MILSPPFPHYKISVQAVPADGREYWWRAEDKRYADYDPWAEFEQPSSSHLQINLHWFAVVKHTSKGVRLDNGQFVRGEAVRQFAVPTQELAIRDLVERKKRHVAGAQARLYRAQEHLNAAEDFMKRHMS